MKDELIHSIKELIEQKASVLLQEKLSKMHPADIAEICNELSEEEAHTKFGYLLDAFKYGAPPHGGMGIGLDRLVMQMLGCESLRDVIAYPKVQNASEPMTECPAIVDGVQLEDLGIEISAKEE